ncbi:MAG TPA: bifunctional DNA primase/polymerase, partial [Aggregatilineales bacterium]|nr:bifunctional DNA primase/polymerase [Aggregatilineales bacterium]
MTTTTINQAAAAPSVLDAARIYAALGLSVIPLHGKRPALERWAQYQQQRASASDIDDWHRRGLLQNVGIVCGEVSGGLTVLDLDGAAGYPAFAATFPGLADTFTVATGGGVGRHVYFYTNTLPPSIKAMGTPIGNLELCASGRQVVAPPSIHPTSGQPYRVAQARDILRVPD